MSTEPKDELRLVDKKNMKKFLKNHAGSFRFLAAAGLGLLLGQFFPSAARYLKPVGILWLNLLFTAVVPLVFFSISSTVAQMTDARKFGRIIGWMLVVFFVTSLISSTLMLVVVKIFPPAAPAHLSFVTQSKSASISAVQKLVEALSTGDFVELLSRKNMLALILFAGLIGWAVFAAGKEGESFRQHFISGNAVMMKLIQLLMKWAPLGLLAYFADLASRLGPQLWGTYRDVIKIYYPVSLFYFFISFTFYAIWAGGVNWMREFWSQIITPSLTAFGTGSSLATIPANLEAADELGIPREVSDIVIPVGATIHMDGTCLSAILKISILFSIFGQPFHGMDVYLTAVGVAILSGVVMSGIPGGGFLGEMLIVTLYGFPAEALPIISMIGTIVDAPATLVNSIGDNVASAMVSRIIYGKKWRKICTNIN